MAGAGPLGKWFTQHLKPEIIVTSGRAQFGNVADVSFWDGVHGTLQTGAAAAVVQKRISVLGNYSL
jgi:hypothetical protein